MGNSVAFWFVALLLLAIEFFIAIAISVASCKYVSMFEVQKIKV